MARYSKSDIVLGGMGPLPLDSYTVKCIDVKKDMTKGDAEKGKSPQPAAYFQFEIIAPQQVTVGGSIYQIAGRKFKPMPVVLDPSVPWGIGQITGALERSQFDMTAFNPEGEFDDDAEGLKKMLGWTCQMQLHTEESFKMRPVTPEEIEAGAKPTAKVPMTDGNGERISNGHWVQASLDKVTGPAMATESANY